MRQRTNGNYNQTSNAPASPAPAAHFGYAAQPARPQNQPQPQAAYTAASAQQAQVHNQPQPFAQQQIPAKSTVSPDLFEALNAEYINGQITRYDATNKVMDFSDMMVKAYSKDFANIHGTGGKDHAPNSGICLSLCDYSKGKGENAISVRIIIDVRKIDRLLSAAEAACNGCLGMTAQLSGIQHVATGHGMVIGWLQGNHPPSRNELIGLERTLNAGLSVLDTARKSEEPVWSFEVQKTNPYQTSLNNNREYAPCTMLSIQYIPSRRYAWNIRVLNCIAPIIRHKNGSCTCSPKEAIDKKEVNFPMTVDDFYDALADVSHYIRLWEYRMLPTVNAMCNERERRIAVKLKEKTN